MKKIIFSFIAFGWLTLQSFAQVPTGGWIDETRMNQLVDEATANQLVMVELSCKFAHDNNPGRADVLFLPRFVKTPRPIGWGWTYDANAPNRAIEEQALSAGFKVFAEDYFEITGQTWVRCKIWHRK